MWKHTPVQFKSDLDTLFRLSESRGKEAAGLAMSFGNSIKGMKRPVPASVLLREKEYKDLFPQSFKQNGHLPIVSVIGHSLLVTDGAQELHDNNQPVIPNRIFGIHNGIIVHSEELWQKFPEITRRYEVDSEVIFNLLSREYTKYGSLTDAVSNTFKLVYGQASIAVFLEKHDQLLLYTNHGSLYYAVNYYNAFFFFAYERFIVEEQIRKNRLIAYFGCFEIKKILPSTGLLVNLETLTIH